MSELQMRRHGLESFLASSPQLATHENGVAIKVLPELGHINLRGNPGSREFVSTVSTILGQDLPAVANTMTIGKHRVFWLGPDEWLLVTQLSDTQELVVNLREALSGQHASVTNLSGGQIILSVSGANVRDVLAKGCTLDLRPHVFGVGSCAQTGLSKANVLIAHVDSLSTYELIVRRSFAEYLALWLRHFAREYGVTFSVAHD